MHSMSYWKTTVIALVGAVLTLSALLWLTFASDHRSLLVAGVFLLALPFVALVLIAAGGMVCLSRDSREISGMPDMFAPLANRAPQVGLVARGWLRALLGPALQPGDVVEVKSLREIAATLDATGALDGLPYMAEMNEYCGKIFRVHRRVDKINDMRHKTGLRRMHDAVTLTEVRCSGSQHDGCEAECQILWKDSWLKRLRSVQPLAPHRSVESSARAEVGGRANAREYVCQMTQ